MFQTMGSAFSLRGVTLKNRVVFAPTTLGLPPEEQLARYSAIARGGAALIIVGDVPIVDGPGPSLYRADGVAAYRRITDAIHAGGALAAAQLHHMDSDPSALLPLMPAIKAGRYTGDELRRLLNDTVSGFVTGLSLQELHELTAAFGTAAALARDAGFDVIQVHGDRFCGSMSSALYNNRTDEYGGTAENRARFAAGAVRAVRAAVPELPIEYKLAVRQENPHYGNAGVLREELCVFVPLLEEAGVDSFHVSLANHGVLRDTIPPADHPYFSAEGCFLPFCDDVRRFTALPIAGVGGLTDPTFVEAQLLSGRIQLAAMSRQLTADPDWPRKALSGEEHTIRRCIRCNRACLGGMQKHQGVHCIYERTESL